LRFPSKGFGSKYALDQIQVHFHRGGLGEHFHGEDQSMPSRLTDEDSLNSFQRPGFDPDPVSIFDKWVWFDLQRAIDEAAYRLDFFRGNIRWPGAKAYEGVNARCGHNAQHPIEAAANEHVIGEKRE
jgi:hypothetical protein